MECWAWIYVALICLKLQIFWSSEKALKCLCHCADSFLASYITRSQGWLLASESPRWDTGACSTRGPSAPWSSWTRGGRTWSSTSCWRMARSSTWSGQGRVCSTKKQSWLLSRPDLGSTLIRDFWQRPWLLLDRWALKRFNKTARHSKHGQWK